MPPLAVSIASPQANDRRILVRAPQALRISRVNAVLSGGTSTTAGNAITNFAIPDIPAGLWLWLQLTAVSGSPQALTVSIELQ